jgi:hypothetical protein
MAKVARSHRVLYVDQTAESEGALRLLTDLGVEFALVQIEELSSDPRGFPRLPVLAFVSGSGCIVRRAGLEEIEAIIEAVRSDYLAELRERKVGEGTDWDPEQIAQMKWLSRATKA